MAIEAELLSSPMICCTLTSPRALHQTISAGGGHVHVLWPIRWRLEQLIWLNHINDANIGRAAKGLPKAAGERAAWLNSQRSAASLLRLAVERR